MPQIESKRYVKKSYLSLERFVSYYYQLRGVSDLVEPGASVLEIGIGSGLVSACLRQLGYDVLTSDFDQTVRPDIVADVRALPVPDASRDVVMACQVLEHLPWEDFELGLRELARVSKKYVIISLPRRHTGFEWIVKFPGIRALTKRTYLDLFVEWPLRFPGFAESGQHYWEIDTWGVSQREVVQRLAAVFRVRSILRPPLNKYHVFFILEKRS